MSQSYTLALGPDCTIRTIRSLRGEMIAAFQHADTLALDCAQVEQVDVTFVQLTVSAAKTSRRQASKLRLINMPQAVEAAFQRAGVEAPGSFHL